MLQAEPYFMQNERWYRTATDEEELESGKGLVLTEEAPPEAVASYEEFYKVEEDPNGYLSD